MGEEPIKALGYFAAVKDIPVKKIPKDAVPTYFSIEELELLFALPDTSKKDRLPQRRATKRVIRKRSQGPEGLRPQSL